MADGPKEETYDREMPFMEHFRELRRRLMISVGAVFILTIIAFAVYHLYIQLLIEPFGDDLQILKPLDGFLTRLKVSFYLGLIASFPLHVYNIIAFIMPALVPRERRLIKWLLGGSFLLFLVGGYIGYFQILPLSINFLASSDFVPEKVSTSLEFSSAIAFVFQLMLGFLVLFQIPLVLLMLMAMNIVKRQWLLRMSRYVIVVIFLLAAILTPPDIVSQIGLALPLILLFYLTILIAKICRFGEVAED